MKLIVIPEFFYLPDENRFNEELNDVKETFLNFYGGNDKFVLEYYYYNREKLLEPPTKSERYPLGRRYIDKFVCDGYGNTKVIHTNKHDIPSEIATLSEEEIKNSCFFMDVLCGTIGGDAPLGFKTSSIEHYFNDSEPLTKFLTPRANTFTVYNTCGSGVVQKILDMINKIAHEIDLTRKEINAIRTYNTSSVLQLMSRKILRPDFNNNKAEDKAETEKKSNLANDQNNTKPELKNNATNKNKEGSFNF